MGNIEYFSQWVGQGNNGRFLQFNVYKRIFKDVNLKLSLSPYDNVLDLGGGCGELAGYLASACRSVELTDGSQEAIDYAQNKLKRFLNITYRKIDLRELPLPQESNSFDKIVCYSVVHYLKDLDNFRYLITETLRVAKLGGIVLIGDIPLRDKYIENLAKRKKNPVKNFLLNQKYYFKKYLVNLLHRAKRVDASQLKGVNYSKEIIKEIMDRVDGIEYRLLAQDEKLPLADSREDLVIRKLN